MRTLAPSENTILPATTVPPLGNTQVKHIPHTMSTTRQHLLLVQGEDCSAISQEGDLMAGPGDTLHTRTAKHKPGEDASVRTDFISMWSYPNTLLFL